jgi:hypothetical protein
MSSGRTSAQHPGNTEVLIKLRPVNLYRHQLKARAHGCARIPQPRIPRARGRNLAAIRQRDYKSLAVKATETGLISPTSISKVLMPFAFKNGAL